MTAPIHLTRQMLGAGLLFTTFLLYAGLSGAVAAWRVVKAFQAGGPVVQWQHGTALVVMAAPLLAIAVCLALPGKRMERPGRSFVIAVLLTVLAAIALGMGDALALEHVASLHGYHHCEALDVWDPHGGRGGGPSLRSWGYTRSDCPAQGPR